MGNGRMVRGTFERTGDPRLYEGVRWQKEDLDVPLWHRRTAHMIHLLEQYLAEHGEGKGEEPLRPAALIRA